MLVRRWSRNNTPNESPEPIAVFERLSKTGVVHNNNCFSRQAIPMVGSVAANNYMARIACMSLVQTLNRFQSQKDGNIVQKICAGDDY